MRDLKSVPLFQDLSLQQLKSLQPHCQLKIFRKGEVLFLEGDACENIVIVREGRLKLSRSSDCGREQVLEDLEENHTCACHSGEPLWNCLATAQAATDGSLWLLSRRIYTDVVATNSRVARRLNQLLAQRLCRFSNLIKEISLDVPDRRLARFILKNTVDGNGGGLSGDAHALQMTHEDIAQRLGLVRETVTRHLQKMKRLRLIDIQQQKIIILNRLSLEQIAEPK